MMLKKSVAVAAGAVVPLVAPATVGATVDDAANEEHCLIEIVGQLDSGEYVTTEPVCYPTLDEVFDRVGAAQVDGGLERGAVSAGDVAAAASALATHFDGANHSGSSITVSGGDCGGGYVNLSSSWVNRISSTANSCPNVYFWTGFDKTGSHEQTGLSTVNLGPLNNASRSVGYA